MSWSVAATGKAPAVGADLERQFANGSKCSEPEETIRQAARMLLAASIAGQDPASVVQISAAGSQSQSYSTGASGSSIKNSLTIAVTPLGTFLE